MTQEAVAPHRCAPLGTASQRVASSGTASNDSSPRTSRRCVSLGVARQRVAAPSTASNDSSTTAPRLAATHGQAPPRDAPRRAALHRAAPPRPASNDSSSGASQGVVPPGPESLRPASDKAPAAPQGSASPRTASPSHASLGIASTTAPYVAVEGSWFTNSDATVLGPIIESFVVDGQIDYDRMVAAASTPGTGIYEWDQDHAYFVWDDKKAARKYRIEQAQEIVRSIHVAIETAEGTTVIRAYPSFEGIGEKTRAYQPWREVYNDPARVAQLGRRFVLELSSIVRRYTAFRQVTQFDENFGPSLAALAAIVADVKAKEL